MIVTNGRMLDYGNDDDDNNNNNNNNSDSSNNNNYHDQDLSTAVHVLIIILHTL